MARAVSTAVILVLAALALVPERADANLMGIGGLLGRSGHRRQRPWETSRNNYPQYYYRMQEEEDEREAQKARIANEEYEGEKPCVGLCYYRKLQALRNGNNNIIDDSIDDNQPMEEEVVFDELTTSRPCVGVCQYYRALGKEPPRGLLRY